MVAKNCILIAVLGAVLLPGALLADEPKLEERSFRNCLLFEAEGRIWLREPMVYLGMWAVLHTPSFCLSEDLGKKFAPLLSDIVTGKESAPMRTKFYTGGMPRLREGKGALFLLRLETKMRMVGGEAPEIAALPPDVRAGQFYEIVSARLDSVEPVTAKWISAWQALDEALKEVVSTSLSPPGDQKRKRLFRAIERASQALNTMGKVEVSEDIRALVVKVEPEVRLVRGFQRRVAGQWQDELEKCTVRLRIDPNTPLPKRLGRKAGLELLTKSNSPAKFMSKIKGSYPDEVLKQRLLYSASFERTVHVGEIEQMAKAQFKKVQADAKKLLAELAEQEQQDRDNERVKQWGVVLRPAPGDLLADKLILRGALVEKILANQTEPALVAGDVIIDYEHTYNFVMGDFDFDRAMKWLANKVRQGRGLRVLRGDQLITVKVKAKDKL